MDRVQYGRYTFPHNPRVIRVTENRGSPVNSYPFLGEETALVGRRVSVVVLEGELFASGVQEALAAQETLRGVYAAGGKELLFLPGRQPFWAVFDRLELTARGDGRVLGYRARFLEAGGG